MSQQDFAAANRLIAGLAEPNRSRLLARCKRVELSMGDVFHESTKLIQHACFPVNCFLSLVTQVDEASDLGVMVVGREGLLGVTIALGTAALPLRARVQHTGDALLIKAADLRDEIGRSPALRDRLNAYTYVLMTQLANSGVCARHPIEDRVARWLLMSGDCIHSDEFYVTHDYLAHMLGVRRPGVTEAAQILQSQGLIKYQRGHVQILDRAGLDAAACSCYRYENDVYRRMLGPA